MTSTQDDPTVVIANGYARLEERVAAWVEDDPGIRAVVVIGGLWTSWNVSAGTRRHEV